MSDTLLRCQGCDASLPEDRLVTIGGKRLCATCKANLVGDAVAGREEGGYVLAGIGRRFSAVLLDGLIVALPVIIIAIGYGLMTAKEAHTGSKGPSFDIVLQLVSSLPALIYQALMLAKGGQTLGKKWMKVKVVQGDGTELTAGHAWKRELSRWFLGSIPLLGLVDYLMASGKDRKTLHDRIGKTIVIDLRG